MCSDMCMSIRMANKKHVRLYITPMVFGCISPPPWYSAASTHPHGIRLHQPTPIVFGCINPPPWYSAVSHGPRIPTMHTHRPMTPTTPHTQITARPPRPPVPAHGRSVQVGDVVLYTGGGPNGGCTATLELETSARWTVALASEASVATLDKSVCVRRILHRPGRAGHAFRHLYTSKCGTPIHYFRACPAVSAPRTVCSGVTCPMTGTLHACVFL